MWVLGMELCCLCLQCKNLTSRHLSSSAVWLKIIYILCMWVLPSYTWGSMCVPGAESLKLELQLWGDLWVLGTKMSLLQKQRMLLKAEPSLPSWIIFLMSSLHIPSPFCDLATIYLAFLKADIYLVSSASHLFTEMTNTFLFLNQLMSSPMRKTLMAKDV